MASRLVVAAPKETVFPLLCPVLEYDWVPYWECDLAYSRSGAAELDCVFVTEFKERGREVWTCTRYEPFERIEYVHVHTDRVIRLEIRLELGPDNTTYVHWTSVVTALNKRGEEYIEKTVKPGYDQEAALIERMLNHYLQTGQALDLEH